MSSRPNSSHPPKNMFSSLPSASKIYVSSTKPRQKHVPCIKRKRKKSVPESNSAESNVDETLISLDDKLESLVDLKLVNSEKVVEFGEKISEIKGGNEDKNFKFSLSADNDAQSNLNHKFVKSKNEDTLLTENELLNPNFQEGIKNSENCDINVTDEIHVAASCESNEEPQALEQTITDFDVLESATEDTEFHEDTLVLPDLTPEDYESNVVTVTVEADIHEEHLSPSKSFSESKISADGIIKPVNAKTETLQQSEVNKTETSSTKNIDNTENISNLDDYSNDATSEDNVHINDDKSSNILPIENKINETASNCICKNSCALKSEIGTQTSPINDVDSIDAKNAELFDTEKFNLRNKMFDDKENFNTCDSNDEAIHSYDQSEQNSCTESGVFESQNTALNDIFSEDFVKQKEQSILYFVKDDDTCDFVTQHNDAKDELKYEDSFNLKRTTSVPADFHTLKDSKPHKNIRSNGILSSDKSTLTNDLFYLKDTALYSNHVEKEVDSFPKLNTTSVASGEDLPFVNILPPLAMIKARMRNYVFGCKGLKGSLLGSDELLRLFPQSKISVFVGTWNMNSHDSPENIDDFLLPLETDTLPDIYAIGVQESMPSKSEWELLLQTTLGPSHVLFTSSSLGALHLVIFLRRDLIWFCSVPEEANIATRVGSMVKTKGAVAVCFMLFGTSFLFVNSHLTAHEHNLVDRISDYEKICSGIDLPRLLPLKSGSNDKDVTSRFDCVFWCGDLNFRIVCGRLDVLRFIKEKFHSKHHSCEDLLRHDQLQNAIKEGAAFLGFKEGMINFNPSFKFDVGTNDFDSTKQRVPSYTDRILYRSKDLSSISCVHYNCVPELVTSDHKPVYAIFNVILKPGRDSVPLAAGIFKRDVYLEAIKRRAKVVEVNWNQKQSTICSIM